MPALAQPSMVCNDWRMPEDNITCFQMQNSWLVPPTATPNSIISHIVNVARSMPNGRLRHLVLHCHGGPGTMIMGCGSFGHDNLTLFKHLAGHIGHIWLVSCQVAQQGTPSPARNRGLLQHRPTQQLAANAGFDTQNYITNRVYNGAYFCRAIAMYAECQVTAADRDQYGVHAPFMPFGQIDNFEGFVRTWDAAGTIIDMEVRGD